MIRVGLVAEGPSDCLALEEMIRTVEPDADFLRIRPDMTLVSRSPHGWTGVRAWCREMGPVLESFLSADPGLPLCVACPEAARFRTDLAAAISAVG